MAKVNRTAGYGQLAITLHWTTLLLIVPIYLTIEIHGLLPRESQVGSVMEDWHRYLGFVLLPIAVVRLLNIRRKTPPSITPTPAAWQLTLTRWMKNYLYVLITGMPLSGWIFLSADGAMLSVWAFPVPAIAPENQGLAQIAGRIHVLLGLSGYLLIPLHALAALFQHYLVKNDTLIRMLPGFMLRRR